MHKARRGNSFLAVNVPCQGCDAELCWGREWLGLSSPCSAQAGDTEEQKPSRLVHGEIHSILPWSYCSVKQKREK